MTPLIAIAKGILEKNNSPAFQRIQGIAGQFNTARNIASIFGL